MNDGLLNCLEDYWNQSVKKEGFDFEGNRMNDEDYRKAKMIFCDMIDMILKVNTTE